MRTQDQVDWTLDDICAADPGPFAHQQTPCEHQVQMPNARVAVKSDEIAPQDRKAHASACADPMTENIQHRPYKAGRKNEEQQRRQQLDGFPVAAHLM
jgi:hypothetical protein